MSSQEPQVTTTTTEKISLAERQRQQRQAQLEFLQRKGLLQEWNLRDEDETNSQEDETSVATDDAQSLTEALQGTTEEEAVVEQKAPEMSMAARVAAAARKTGVAVVGGSLVTAGAILAPLPTPGGVLLAGAGLSVLGTEFDGAKQVLDAGKSQLVRVIDSIASKEAKAETDSESEAATIQQNQSVDDNTTDGARTTASVDKKPVRNLFAKMRTQAHRLGQNIRPHLVGGDEQATRSQPRENNTETLDVPVGEVIVEVGKMSMESNDAENYHQMNSPMSQPDDTDSEIPSN